MDYKQALDYIENTSKFSIKLGLSRTEKILQILGNPQNKLKCIHIAGTNGKGSVTSMISNILKQSGYKVGMYTSPYIEEFQERIQINGTNISKDKLADVVTKVSKAVDEVIKLGYDNPTQFEIITCAAFLYFYNENVDFAVIEVGLGGRLDSTNVITPILSIITSISYDHINILGDTLEKIAFEKAGIIKTGVPVVLYPQENEVEKVISKVCIEKQCSLIRIPKGCTEFLNCKDIKVKDKISTVQNIKVTTYEDLYNIQLPLLGKHQLLNCATALYAVEQLKKLNIKIDKECILKGLFNVRWMGRFEILNRNPLVVIDGAHNIDGIKKLKESVDTYLKYNNIVLILGILADKQVKDMIKVITPKAKKVICVTPHSNRAELASKLKEYVEEYNENCEYVEDYKKAYKLALSYCNREDLLLISGSLYMIGDMRKIITNTIL